MQRAAASAAINSRTTDFPFQTQSETLLRNVQTTTPDKFKPYNFILQLFFIERTVFKQVSATFGQTADFFLKLLKQVTLKHFLLEVMQLH